MQALKESGVENFENYKILMKKLNRIKNPKNFYRLIKKWDIFTDIFLWYKEGDGLVYSFETSEERFNEGLQQLGLIDSNGNEIIKPKQKRKTELEKLIEK